MVLRTKQQKNSNAGEKVRLKKRHSEYIVFNFSFIDKNLGLDRLETRTAKKFFERIGSLSTLSIDKLLQIKKEQGLEFVPDKQVKLTVSQEFMQSGRHHDCHKDMCVFRLNKEGRVIGKLQDNIFYVLGVDTDFKAYKH